VLEVRIKKKFTGFNLDVELSAKKEILTVLGPSGSGKTMTLKCIAGLIRPDEGYIRLGDRVLFDSEKRINLPPRQRKVGFVFQDYALFPHMTVNNNITFGLQIRKREETIKRITGLLEKMHIRELGHRYPAQLSSGQQQRVAIARALFHEPEILLLDEPFSALDTHRKEDLELELLNLHKTYEGDMVFVTHDVAQGYKLGSRIAVFESGSIVQCDTKQKVIESPVNCTVARLTGVKNLIEGDVVSKDTEYTLIAVPGLEQPVKVISTGDDQVFVNQHVTIGIRPENIYPAKGPVGNMISTVITNVVEGVAGTDCYLKVNSKNSPGFDIEMHLSKSEAAGMSEGQTLVVFLPPGRLTIIKN
jgi:molybdate transport system ATP-binding protein